LDTSDADNDGGTTEKHERILQGISSGYIGNKISDENKQILMKQREPSRKVAIQQGKQPWLDIEILCKLNNSHLIPSMLCFGDNGFSCVNLESGQLVDPEFSYNYSYVSEIIMRTRAEHADIKFENSTLPIERFRFMASYLQVITNELVIRTGNNIKVTFEAGAKEFQYNCPVLSYDFSVKIPHNNVEKKCRKT